MSGGRALSGRVRKARSEAARFPARLRASAAGVARERVAPNSSSERGGLGTGSQEQRLRARPRESYRARLVAGQSRFRRLVADGERGSGMLGELPAAAPSACR
jgi:hypothetical protein